MFLLLASFLTAIAIGTLLALILMPAGERQPGGLVFCVCTGAGVGIGITSCLYFVALLLGQMRHIIVIEVALAVLLILLWVILGRKASRLTALPEKSVRHQGNWLQKVLYTVLGVTAVSSLVSLVLSLMKDPHGKWDAWLIWNMHARFIFRNGEAWRNLFTSGIDWTHLDYPLMLPLSVVRAWQYAEGENLYTSVGLSLIFVFATIGLLYASLKRLQGPGQGVLGGLALMGSPFFLILGAYQVADVPLGFFILVTLITFTIHDRFPEDGSRILLLAGLSAGLAGWTKNEGLLFLALAPMVRLAVVVCHRGWIPAGKELLWFCAGALPALTVLVVFKVLLSPPNDIFAGQTVQSMTSRLMDVDRYVEILKAYLLTGFTFTQGIVNIQTGLRFNPGTVGVALLIVYLMLTGVKVHASDRTNVMAASLTLLFMAGGFFAVYLLTPRNLHWHLTTSLNRLLMQLWPSCLFVFFTVACSPDQTGFERSLIPTAVKQGSQPGRRKRNRTSRGKEC